MISSFRSVLGVAKRCSSSCLATGLASVLVVALVPTPAEAQQSNNQLRSHSTRNQQLRPVERHRAQIEARRANRHRVSGLGSAANARPGFYSQLLSQPVVQNGPYQPSYGYHAPYVVYVDPTPREPRIAGDRQPAPQPTYQPPPIYIVQPQPAPAQPAPVYEPPPEPQRPAEPRKPRPTAPQGITMTVFPADAEVFLDDELLGAASGLGTLDLKPGVYVLEISHAEYPDQRLVFGVEDEPLKIAIDLSADRPSRRSRIR